MNVKAVKARRAAALHAPTKLAPETIREIAGALNGLLVDAFVVYLKTKNFHRHVSAPLRAGSRDAGLCHHALALPLRLGISA